MPDVPQYESQVESQRTPDVRSNYTPPVEAFGGGAANQVPGAVGELAGTISKIAKDAYEEAQEVEFQKNALEATRLKNDLQVRVSQLQGRDAGKASELIETEWRKGVERLGKNLTGRFSKVFERDLGGQFESLRHQTDLHTAHEFAKADDQETQSAIEQEINSARLNAFDEREIGDNRARIKDFLTLHAKRRGYLHAEDGSESPVFRDRLVESTSLLHASVIQARLDAGQYHAAKAQFDRAKKEGEISAKHMDRIEAALDNQAVVVEGSQVWSKIMDSEGARLPNGELNQEMILKSVEGAKGLNPKRAEAVRNYVKAKMSEQFFFDNKASQERERQFQAYVLEQKKAGTEIDTIMKAAPAFARDAVDQAENEEFIRKLYSTEKAQPQQVSRFMDVKDMIAFDQGNVDLEFLKREKDTGAVTETQYRQLRDYYRTAVTQDVRQEIRSAKQQVVQVAKEKYKNRRDYDAFRLVFDEKAEAMKNPQDIKDLANDLMAKDPATQHTFPFTWGGEEKFKVMNRGRQNDQEKLRSFYTDLGKDETNEILSHYRKEEGAANSKTLENFAKELGGPSQLRQGMPANNAIQSIIQYNRQGKGKIKLTPENVKRILKQYPNGIVK